MTHTEATKMVKGERGPVGGRKQRKIGNNTYAYIEHDGSVAIELHGTKVVVIYPNGLYKLNSGGWQTSTTKDRINKYSPVKVYQKKHVWYLGDGTPFEDNILVNK
jgi:hypothetical protein